MEPYRRHVLVCTGGFCSPDRRGRALYSLLASLLEREGLLFGPTRVKRGETPCLGVCAGGPIVVVYPEGTWYSGVTPELLERIVVEHLKEQIHRLKREGLTILLAEQNVGFCLDLADRVYILEKGHIRYHGSAREFREDESIRQQYLAL